MRGAVFAFGALAACFASPAQAQDDGLVHGPKVKWPEIAATAREPKGFVPKGWAAVREVKGDLNGDKIDDVVLLLRDKDPKNVIQEETAEDGSYDTNPWMIVAGFGDGAGYKLALANHSLIGRPDNPGQEDPMSEGGGVSIDRGSLVVGFYYFMRVGGPESGFWSYRFRPEKGGFRLIGYEAERDDRMSGAVTTVSINYLTGKVIEKTEGGEADMPRTVTKRLKSKAPVMIEDVGDGLAFVPEY